MRTLQLFLVYSPVAILLVSVSWFFVHYRRWDQAYIFLGWLLTFNLVIELIAKWLAWHKQLNLPLLHIYTIGEFLLLSLFYEQLLPKRFFWNRLFWPFTGVVLLLIILNSLYLQPPETFNSNARTLVQVVYIIFAVQYFFYLTSSEDAAAPSLRWINSAVLIYYSGSLFIFMLSNYLQQRGIAMPRSFWAFNGFLNLIYQLLILRGLWMGVSRQAKSSLS